MTESARRGGVARALIKKELREISRDGRFWVLGLAVLGLLLVTLGFSYREAASIRAEREAAQAAADEHFRAQDDKNPHVAAHYGTYVFKPTSVLTFLNPGVDAFVGASLKLEAHRRNALEGARARDGTALARFGRLSVASVVELLLPLLIIGVGFSAWTAERERGTLRQLASLGVQPARLLAGKLTALGLAVAAVLLPAGACIVWAATRLAGEAAAPSAGRLAALLGVYAVHALVWLLLTLWVSARSASSRSALVALLGIWVVTSLVVPRLTTSAAVALASVPSQSELAAAVRESLEQGLPGSAGRENRVSEISEQLLEEHGFAGAETLMDASLLNGIELQAEAKFENEVIDHHFAEYERRLSRQERVAQAFGVLSPMLTVRGLAMSLAGTDAAHHRHFSDQAEQHRRGLIELLNREFAERGGAAGFDYKAGRELWDRAPKFSYTAPSLGWAAERGQLSLAVLACWLLLAGLLAYRAAAKLKVT